jgi:hypothetical protein
VARDILYQATEAGVQFLKLQAITTIPTPSQRIFPAIRHDSPTSSKPKEDNLRPTPRVEVLARRGQPVTPHFSGNWTVILVVTVISNSQDSTDAQHQARVEEILNFFLSDTIADDLSNATANFFVPVVVPTERETEIDGKLWRDSITVELRECCCQDLN